MDRALPIKPGRIGLGALRQFVACALLDNSPDEFGPFAIIVMRADAPENEVRYAIERLGFEQERPGWGRADGQTGEVSGLFFDTYGSLARNLAENNRRAFAPYLATFPPGTVVLQAAIRAKPTPPELSEPRLRVQATATWSCTWSPTYNDDWHDDALCSNGTEHVRPYLRPEDSFITPEELMGSARDYERHLNGG